MRIALIFSLLTLCIGRLTAQPISLHAGNPHYFNFKGTPTVLVTSAEHYGSVINPDFDFSKYLQTLKSIGLNHTRIWLGDYVEKPGDFCLSENTSAPLPGKFLAPWARSNEPGFAAGGNKFDLDKWNPDFFTRLHAFMKEASDKGIVVECILFFVGPNWHLLPMNPANNINNTTKIEGRDYLTLNNGNILDHQKKLCLKLINELNQYDNFFFNIANEPWFSNQEHSGFASPPRNETKEWIRTVAEWIVNEEKNLLKQHLISIDYTNEGRIISKEEQEKYWKNISVFNHHYDKDALSVKFNYGINKVLSFNETGLMPPSTSQYRIQGWKYLMSGGALYNNLDFTFQVGSEDGSGGTEFLCNGYNGCNDKGVKYEMAALLKFMNSFDFVNCRPNYNVVSCAWGDQNFCVLENPGKEYAIYIYGGTNKGAIQLGLVAGKYDLFWINPSDGKIIERTEIETDKSGGLQLNAPAYAEDITLLLRYQPPTYDVHVVFTERKFSSYWNPATGWNPFLKNEKPFNELTLLYHVYTGSVNTGKNESGTINLEFKGNSQIQVPEGKYCLHFAPKDKNAIAGATYKHKGIKGVKEHGSSPWEEYICDFSTYQKGGKFYFRYWLAKDAKYYVMSKVDTLNITGTGQWEDAIIDLGRELFTHHTLIWLENRNDPPVDIYIDDAFFYKGKLPNGLVRAKEMRENK